MKPYYLTDSFDDAVTVYCRQYADAEYDSDNQSASEAAGEQSAAAVDVAGSENDQEQTPSSRDCTPTTASGDSSATRRNRVQCPPGDISQCCPGDISQLSAASSLMRRHQQQFFSCWLNNYSADELH